MVLWLVLPCAGEEPPMPAVHLVPVDKGFSKAQIATLLARGQQRVYTGDARTTLGMPCGGICAGQLYVLGDGTLGCWQIDGSSYFAGTGQTSYRTYRPERPVAQGFAIAARGADGRVRRATLDDAGYDAIEFVGEYPRALIRYRGEEGIKSAARPQVQVDLEVFSPFVPLSARDSAWPATVLRFTVTNPTDAELDVALGGWLENMVCRERTSAITIRRRNQTIAADGLTTILMDAIDRKPPTPPEPRTRVIADFESGTYDGWTVTGEAFGQTPAAGTLPDQSPVSGFGGQYLVNSFADGDHTTGKMVSRPFRIDLPYLTFRIGGGRHAGTTCLNLVVDDQVVRSATGRDQEALEPRAWDVSEFASRVARLEIIDTETGGWGHVNVDDIALTNALSDEFREYDEKALGFGNMALSLLGDGLTGLKWVSSDAFIGSLLAKKAVLVGGAELEPGFGEPLIGTVTSRFALPPGEFRDVTFVVSWYFPNLHTGHGRMYTNWFRDARDVATQLARDLERLRAETVRFCDTYYRATTLPWWLAARLMMPASTLATGTAQWWQDGRFWGWEGAYCCEGTCTHVWNYAQAEAWLFPELARSVRTMQDLGAGFEETTGLVGFRSNLAFAADGQAGTVLKCYREHLTSADDTFLRRHWSRIKAALEYLVSQDIDDEGVIKNDRQPNTYDIDFAGPNTFVGALYLAALRAGEEMAVRMDDLEAARRYRELFERGRAWTAANLFNGEYFEQRLPPEAPPPWQYVTGCLSDQLFGQTWAHLLHLGYLYPPEQVRSALAAVFKYNWAPDVGPLNEVYPPERWFARPGEPGLFVCTWPHGGRPEEPVRYRDEVWTGIEYQVVAGLLWEGMADEALLILHGIDQRYDGTKHNPWNEVECGDHYARALASWGVLHALAGFTYDGPAGKLSIAPRMQQDEFRSFFAAGTGWGNLAQRRWNGDRPAQADSVQVRFGTLRVKEIVTEVLTRNAGSAASASVSSLDGKQAQPAIVPTIFQRRGNRVEVEFDPPVQLKAGQELGFTIQ
jgi:non-lysosomal glucosylceramidase